MFIKASISLLICVFVVVSCSSDRKVVVTWNPNCSIPECSQVQNTSSYMNVIYVKSTGHSDIIHTIYTSYHNFTILTFRSDLSASLDINWPKFLVGQSDAIKIINSKVINDKALYMIPFIYEFNDENGNADMSKVPHNQTVTYKTSELIWSKFNGQYKNSIGLLEGKINTDMNSTKNSFKFILKNPGTLKRDTDLPHLLLKPESNSIDFIINVPSKYDLSKFGVQFQFASSAQTMSQQTKSTIDDEYTPGTFKIWNFQFDNNSTSVNYFQCKPIFYFFEPKALENSTLAIKYDTLKVSGENNYGFLENYATNFSFGIEGTVKDGYFYNQTEYSSWSFSVGMGSPPDEKMSFIVTLVIAVGFGLPACIILVGILVMMVRRIRNGARRTEFQVLD